MQHNTKIKDKMYTKTEATISHKKWDENTGKIKVNIQL